MARLPLLYSLKQHELPDGRPKELPLVGLIDPLLDIPHR